MLVVHLSDGSIRPPSPNAAHYALPLSLIQDSRLSFTARGLLIHLLTTEEASADCRALSKEGPQGRHALLTAMRELREIGYITQTPKRVPGVGLTTVVDVYPTPDHAPRGPVCGPQDAGGSGFLGSENLESGNRTSGGSETPVPQGEAEEVGSGFPTLLITNNYKADVARENKILTTFGSCSLPTSVVTPPENDQPGCTNPDEAANVGSVERKSSPGQVASRLDRIRKGARQRSRTTKLSPARTTTSLHDSPSETSEITTSGDRVPEETPSRQDLIIRDMGVDLPGPRAYPGLDTVRKKTAGATDMSSAADTGPDQETVRAVQFDAKPLTKRQRAAQDQDSYAGLVDYFRTQTAKTYKVWGPNEFALTSALKDLRESPAQVTPAEIRAMIDLFCQDSKTYKHEKYEPWRSFITFKLRLLNEVRKAAEKAAFASLSKQERYDIICPPPQEREVITSFEAFMRSKNIPEDQWEYYEAQRVRFEPQPAPASGT